MSDNNSANEMAQDDELSGDSGPEMELETPEVDIEMKEEVNLEEKAERCKEEGNEYYKQKNYSQAIQLYTQAIDTCPNTSAYYGNRAACFMMMGQYTQALEDARRALQIDPQFIKGHLREAKCHFAMGETAAAVVSYQKVLQLDSSHSVALKEVKQAQSQQQYLSQADSSYNKGDYRHALYCLERCIETSPGCKKFRVQKAECLALLKRYQESQEIANDILRMEAMNADAVYVRGLCLYYQDSIEKAFQHFQQVLRLSPDHQKARDIYKRAKNLLQKKEAGNTAFRSGRMQEAYELYTEALEIDPNNVFTNSKLYCNRATVCSKLKKLDQAIKDCSRAVQLDDTYIKAYLRRAKCYMDSELFEEAVRDYEKILKMDKTKENKRLLQDAKLALKKSKRKDFYKVLGVSKDASEDEIKKAYKKRALMHHPDRHSNATEEERKEEEKKFKEMGEAYSVLSDPKKKARFDSGQDLDDMEGGGGFHDIDPNVIFQSFFGGGGGPGGPGGFPFGAPPQGFSPGGGFTFQFG